MKGNRGALGERGPDVPVVVKIPDELNPPARRRPMRLILFAAVSLLIGVGALGVLFAMARDDEATVALTATVPGPGGRTGPAASPTTPATAATPASTSPSVTATSPTPARTSTATSTPVSNPTPSPSPTATAANPTPTPDPNAPPTVRTRYVVASGDACEVIRAKFKFTFDELGAFTQAFARLSGRAPAAACNLFPGDVLCIPTRADLAIATTLTRDDACLAPR